LTLTHADQLETEKSNRKNRWEITPEASAPGISWLSQKAGDERESWDARVWVNQC
jgi:hypothetical protein